MDARRYRMVVTSRTDYVRTGALVDEQLRHWLAQPPKRYNVDAFAEGRNEIARGVTLDHDSVTGATGTYGRWRLRETAPGGTWQTTVVTRQIADGPTWVQLDVEHLPDDAEAAPVPAKTPRLAKHLLEALDAHDGLADVTAMPQVVEAEDVEAVIDELCDAHRRLPVVMASTPSDVDFDAWLEGTVDPLVRPLVGLAILYVLTPEAESVFNRALEHHRVYNGGIRTYLPGVDPAWPADGQRHRVMSKRLIAENPRLAARILNQLPQGIATRLPLPDALDSVPLMRTRARDGVGGSEQERLRDENDALHEILEEAAREQRVRADEIRDLKRELRQAEGNEAQVVVDYDEQYKELHRAKAQIRELQRAPEAWCRRAGLRDGGPLVERAHVLRRDSGPDRRYATRPVQWPAQVHPGTRRPGLRLVLGPDGVGRPVGPPGLRGGRRERQGEQRFQAVVCGLARGSARHIAPQGSQGRIEVREGEWRLEPGTHVPRPPPRASRRQAVHGCPPADRRRQHHRAAPALLRRSLYRSRNLRRLYGPASDQHHDLRHRPAAIAGRGTPRVGSRGVDREGRAPPGAGARSGSDRARRGPPQGGAGRGRHGVPGVPAAPAQRRTAGPGPSPARERDERKPEVPRPRRLTRAYGDNARHRASSVGTAGTAAGGRQYRDGVGPMAWLLGDDPGHRMQLPVRSRLGGDRA